MTTVMADARATMERLARLAKAQVHFDPARRPEEKRAPPGSTCLETAVFVSAS